MADVRITIRQDGLERLFGPSGPVWDRVDQVRHRTEAFSTATASVDTGFLRNNRSSSIQRVGNSIVADITYHADYALFVMKGTGIYRSGRPIRPKRAQYLVFRGRDGGLVYAREVRGQRANPFLVEALEAVSPWPVRRH